MLKISDAFDSVWLEETFIQESKAALESHPLIQPTDMEKLSDGQVEDLFWNNAARLFALS